MLESLQIRDFAIIDSVQLEFDSGLSALTGETGAGKSILLDAIKLIAGDRADSDSIRNDCERAEISVCFNLDSVPAAIDWLAEHEMSAAGECVLRRVISANGRSKAFINGHNATLLQLRELSELLIDIHGQHEHQSLQKAQVQRRLLDAFIGDSRLLEEVRQKFSRWRELEHQLQQARSGSREREERIDLLGLYCEELNQLNPVADEYETLQNDYRRLSNAGMLLEKTATVLGQLYENDEQNIQSALAQCDAVLTELRETDERLISSQELVAAAMIQLQEATAELRAYRDGIELDEESLANTNERIAALQNLARKHRVEVAELEQLRHRLNRELEALQGDAFDLDAIEAELDKAREDYRFSAGELSLKRRQTAAALSEQITEVMQQLGMEGGSFVIDVAPRDEFSAEGSDRVGYLVSANPGQPAKSLARVASGGELSRISLAVQVIMSESSQIPTLIFDEVDSGVGGGVAEIVGKKLRLLGEERQVFCVTHLPQVASQAHHHYRVDKLRKDGDTKTAVVALDADQRRDEIARMLGGLTITEQTRAHASEMIAAQE